MLPATGLAACMHFPGIPHTHKKEKQEKPSLPLPSALPLHCWWKGHTWQHRHPRVQQQRIESGGSASLGHTRQQPMVSACSQPQDRSQQRCPAPRHSKDTGNLRRRKSCPTHLGCVQGHSGAGPPHPPSAHTQEHTTCSCCHSGSWLDKRGPCALGSGLFNSAARPRRSASSHLCREQRKPRLEWQGQHHVTTHMQGHRTRPSGLAKSLAHCDSYAASDTEGTTVRAPPHLPERPAHCMAGPHTDTRSAAWTW